MSMPSPDRRPARIDLFAGALAVIATLLAAGPAAATYLRVSVTDLRSTDGTVHVALYDSADAFAKSDGMLADLVVPASAPTATFDHLKPGIYAVAVYHDENANGHFDRGFLGIPKEGYGFSNDATAFLGAPEFADAAFPVGDTGATITVRMTYW